MFKFGTIGSFKQVRNNPRCKAEKDFAIGTAVVLDEATKLAKAPVDDDVKGELYVVGNIIDKPEINDNRDFKVLKDEYVRGFLLSDLKDLPVELDSKVVVTDYASIKVGDKLVAKTDTGLWEVNAEVTGYKIYLEVVEKTTFFDKGLYCMVRVAW